MRSLDPSREAGAVLIDAVRVAEAGYHGDPDLFKSFSAFHGEMLRRFWATCKRMNSMISFQFGLPSNIILENCDTRLLINFLTRTFMNTVVSPNSQSETEATRLLWI